MASLRRMIANQQNALKSTGPKTVEGKEESRQNAFKHGLAGQGVVTDEETDQAIATRLVEWRALFHLVDMQDEWFFSELVVNTVKLERARREESVLCGYLMERARVFWNNDRALETEELAAKISRNPALIWRKLNGTRHGCEWLIRRWGHLLSIIESSDPWDEHHQRLLDDLSGIPLDLRRPDDASRADKDDPELIAYVHSQIADLESIASNELSFSDRMEHDAASLGFYLKAPKPLSQVRHYIAGFTRVYENALARLTAAGRCVDPKSTANRVVKSAMPVAAPCPVVPPPKPADESKPPTLPQIVPAAELTPALNPPARLPEAVEPAPRTENRRSRRARMKQSSRR